MPAYPGNGLATLLRNNTQVYLWNNETVPASAAQGSLSVAFQLERVNRTYYKPGVSFEVVFSGAPGTFEIDIMVANNDNGVPSPGNYVQVGTITTVNASNVGRFDLSDDYSPRYIAAFMKTLSNSVKVTLQVSK